MKRFFCILLLSILANSVVAQFSELEFQQLGAKRAHVKALGAFSADSIAKLPTDTLISAWNGSVASKGGKLYIKVGGMWAPYRLSLFSELSDSMAVARSLIGTGGGLAGGNLGSSYRLYAPGSSGIKTLALTGPLAGDSITPNTITLSVSSNGISNSLIRQSSGLSIIGRSTNSTGNVADISAASDYNILRRSGTTLDFGSIDLSQSGAVGSSRLGTSNLFQGSGLSVLGVTGNSTGNHASITASSDGQVLRRNGTALDFGALSLSNSNAVTGRLPYSNITQGSALSVLGNSGNSTADHASITAASDGQVLRRNGTTLGFGQLNLASGNAVTGVLPAANHPYASGSTDGILTSAQFSEFDQDYFTQNSGSLDTILTYPAANILNAKSIRTTSSSKRLKVTPTIDASSIQYDIDDNSSFATLTYGSTTNYDADVVGKSAMLTLTGNTVLNLTNSKVGTYYTIKVKGAYDIQLPGGLTVDVDNEAGDSTMIVGVRNSTGFEWRYGVATGGGAYWPLSGTASLTANTTIGGSYKLSHDHRNVSIKADTVKLESKVCSDCFVSLNEEGETVISAANEIQLRGTDIKLPNITAYHNAADSMLVFNPSSKTVGFRSIPTGGSGTIGLSLGSSGTDANVSGSPASLGGSLTLNLPTASASNRGLLSASDHALFTAKQATITESDDYLGFSSNVLSTNTTFQTLTDGATITFTTANGTNAKVTLGGNRTLSIPSPQNGKIYTIKVKQSPSGGNTLALPGGSSATLNTTADAITTLSGLYDGTDWVWRSDGTSGVTLAGQNYLSISAQTITANAVDLSGSNATGTLAAGRFPALTGDVTTTAGSLSTTIANNAVTTAKINDNAVSLAKMATMATASILGRNTASTGNVEVLSATTVKSLLGLSGTGYAKFSSTTASFISSIPNSDLANSTISGISLGSNLANLTATNSTLTFSGTYNGGTARTIGLNLGNANTWTADQSVPDEVYDATTWNGSVEVPTKNAVRDKIESLSGGTTPSIGGTLTSATAGSVLFAGSGTFAQDNSNFFWNNTNKTLSIGSNTSISQLFLNSDATSGYRGLTIDQHSGDAAANYIGFRKSRGTLASPSTVVSGDYTGGISMANYDGTAYRSNAGFGYRTTGTIGTNSIPGQWYWAASTADDTDPFSNGTVRMVVGTDGRVGIGTTSPTADLDITKSVGSGGGVTALVKNSSSAGEAALSIKNDSYYAAFELFGSSFGSGLNNKALFTTQSGVAELGFATLGSAPIAFRTNSSGTTNERMTITSAGNVGINNTSPSERLHVTGNGKFSGTVEVADDAYGSGWNGSSNVPTKNAVYDKIESLGIGTSPIVVAQRVESGKTASDASFLTYTNSTACNQTYLICTTLRLNSGPTGSVTLRVSYTNNAGTPIDYDLFIDGSSATSFGLGGSAHYSAIPIMVQAGTTITMKSIVSGGASLVYEYGASIQDLRNQNCL